MKEVEEKKSRGKEEGDGGDKRDRQTHSQLYIRSAEVQSEPRVLVQRTMG